MAHMEKQSYSGEMLELSVHGSLSYVPIDVISERDLILLGQLRQGEDHSVRQYISEGCMVMPGEPITSARIVKGLFTRYSAPGYLDCTDWEPVHVNKNPVEVLFDHSKGMEALNLRQ